MNKPQYSGNDLQNAFYRTGCMLADRPGMETRLLTMIAVDIYCLFLNIPARTRNIPQNVNDSHRPSLSPASFTLAANLGMCRSTNHPPTIMPDRSAAKYRVGGMSIPNPPANKQTPQK